MTDHERIARLEAHLQQMQGTVYALQTISAALIAKHPDPDQLKLYLASVTEWMLTGDASAHLSESGKKSAREVLEYLQGVRSVNVRIDPLQALRVQPPRKPR